MKDVFRVTFWLILWTFFIFKCTFYYYHYYFCANISFENSCFSFWAPALIDDSAERCALKTAAHSHLFCHDLVVGSERTGGCCKRFIWRFPLSRDCGAEKAWEQQCFLHRPSAALMGLNPQLLTDNKAPLWLRASAAPCSRLSAGCRQSRQELRSDWHWRAWLVCLHKMAPSSSHFSSDWMSLSSVRVA